MNEALNEALVEAPNIIFVDIDGPLFPGKMNLFSVNRRITQAKLNEARPMFDPFAIQAHNLWARYSNAKIVLSTNWVNHISVDAVKEIMRQNGLAFDYHTEIITPKKLTSSRSNEISFWLNENKYKNFIAVDDDPSCKYLDKPRGGWIDVDFAEGLSYKNFLEGCELLGIDLDVLDKEEFGIEPITANERKVLNNLGLMV